MQGLDEQIILFFQSIRLDALTIFFKLFIPHEIWYGVALVLVLFFFFRTGILRAPIISFVLARAMATFCYDVAKNFFHRPRPFLTIHQALPLATPHGFSFPSGHATLAMASAVVLAYHFPKARKLVLILAILVGVSRIYLGAHYLTDVLGGFVLGGTMGGLAIFLERGIISLTQGVQLQKKALVILLVTGIIAFNPLVSQAKGGDEQDQIILLNDSAAALEDSNPELSKNLTKLADTKEKEWENNNVNKVKLSDPIIDKNAMTRQEQARLLKAAAHAIEPTYPAIAKALSKMAKDLDMAMDLKK